MQWLTATGRCRRYFLYEISSLALPSRWWYHNHQRPGCHFHRTKVFTDDTDPDSANVQMKQMKKMKGRMIPLSDLFFDPKLFDLPLWSHLMKVGLKEHGMPGKQLRQGLQGSQAPGCTAQKQRDQKNWIGWSCDYIKLHLNLYYNSSLFSPNCSDIWLVDWSPRNISPRKVIFALEALRSQSQMPLINSGLCLVDLHSKVLSMLMMRVSWATN